MQQTQTYKLNKPETTDVFTPAPLNENADKLEAALSVLNGAVAATDARHCIDYLLGPVTPEEGKKELIINLSGIDLTKYGALVLVYAGETLEQPLALNINSSPEDLPLMCHSSGTSSYSKYSGGGLGVMIPAGTHIYGVCMSGGQLPGTHSGTSCRMLSTPWTEISSFRLFPVTSSTFLTLFGLRF